MRTRIAILVAIVALLLIASVALRQGFGGLSLPAQGSALAQSNGPPLAQYVVVRDAASGGGYHLTSLTLRQAQGGGWQVSGVASGGGYRLLGPASPGGGNQCCCTFLPCVLRNYYSH